MPTMQRVRGSSSSRVTAVIKPQQLDRRHPKTCKKKPINMYRASTEDATMIATGKGATYKALLDYYSNARSAASHIVSLTLSSLNESLTPGLAGSKFRNDNNNNNANTTSELDDDALDATNFYVITESRKADLSIGVSSNSGSGSGSSATDMPVWLIPSYSGILLFAVLGNLLVISTLMQNRRMRTITNLFLLNLAISDILLGVLCMPVTLVGTLLRNFIFGEFLCKLIQFSQGYSLS
ncbi:trissin receptor-like [Drosophila innubila]|uniref:trissin receptor-like n=1 Tax=Drosophila innubila TaxID=198719 RepID=UPI00148D791B|nr:trissin receptor-like [Drosophila innubila]